MFDMKSEWLDPRSEPMNLYHFSILVGKASRLIEKMIERGETPEEIEQATKYYYVILDAARISRFFYSDAETISQAANYHLDWRKAYADFGIEELTKKYGIQKGETDDQNVL